MFTYFNIIWILCIVLLFISFFMLFKRKQRARQAALNGNYTNTGHNANFIVVDMDGRPTQQQNPYPATYAPPPPSSSAQTTYRPPETNPVEPPPPSYQDYTKDHRVPNV